MSSAMRINSQKVLWHDVLQAEEELNEDGFIFKTYRN